MKNPMCKSFSEYFVYFIVNLLFHLSERGREVKSIGNVNKKKLTFHLFYFHGFILLLCQGKTA